VRASDRAFVTLEALRRPIFTTREVAAMRASSISAASQALQRLAVAGSIVRVTRGVWCRPSDPRFSVNALVPFLAGSHPAYISFFSALRLHGMIEQIPQVVYAATTAHTRTVRTQVGTFSFHQLSTDFFGGYDWYGDRDSFLIASPEKAILDCLYLSGRKGRRFGRFPELDLRGFRMAEARRWVRAISDPSLRKHVRDKLEALPRP
jgi:predicted transcriptional regulator of viral defense system